MSGASFCQSKNLCAAGQRVNTFGSATSPGVVCEPCAPGMAMQRCLFMHPAPLRCICTGLYQPFPNLLGACSSKTPCSAGQYAISLGNATSSGADCRPCPTGLSGSNITRGFRSLMCFACCPGSFSAAPNLDLSCQPKQGCNSSAGFVHWGASSISHAQCEVCPFGESLHNACMHESTFATARSRRVLLEPVKPHQRL